MGLPSTRILEDLIGPLVSWLQRLPKGISSHQTSSSLGGEPPTTCDEIAQVALIWGRPLVVDATIRSFQGRLSCRGPNRPQVEGSPRTPARQGCNKVHSHSDFRKINCCCNFDLGSQHMLNVRVGEGTLCQFFAIGYPIRQTDTESA